MCAADPRSKELTKEEVKSAVIEICDKRGVPVVQSKDIERLDWVTVQKQTVDNRLEELREDNEVNSLSFGSGHLWWVPEDGDAEGEVDVSVIEWESIAPEEIPEWVIEGHPQVDDPNYWEKLANDWSSAGGKGAILLLFGAVGFVLQDNLSISRANDLELVSAILLLGGLAVLVTSFLVLLVANIGQFLEDQGILQWIRDYIERAKNRVLRWVSAKLPSDLEE